MRASRVRARCPAATRVDIVLACALLTCSRVLSLQAEAKMAEIQASMDQRLNSMPPSQRQQYTELITEQQQLQVRAAVTALELQRLPVWQRLPAGLAVGSCVQTGS